MRLEHGRPQPPRSQIRHSASSMISQPAGAHDHSSDQADDCHHADELATLPPAAKLLQPPYAARSSQILRRAPVSGCQLHQQS